jgi:hypothetical protein
VATLALAFTTVLPATDDFYWASLYTPLVSDGKTPNYLRPEEKENA